MLVRTFKDLVVWQKSHQLVLKIYRLTERFPPHERYSLVDQVRRSSVSIVANIVEGYKKGKKEYIRFLEISKGSLEETKYFLLLSADLGYLTQQEYNELLSDAEEIGRILYTFKEKLKLSISDKG